jgi:hypothetical protein
VGRWAIREPNHFTRGPEWKEGCVGCSFGARSYRRCCCASTKSASFRCLSRHAKDYARLSATLDQFKAFAEAVSLMMKTPPNYSAARYGSDQRASRDRYIVDHLQRPSCGLRTHQILRQEPLVRTPPVSIATHARGHHETAACREH